MQRAHVLTIVLMALAVMLAGCAQNGQEAGPDDNQTDGNDTNGNQTGGNGNQTGGGDGNVTSVTVLSFNETASPGENVTVCWSVEGSGNIPHTALHYDNETHNETNATFSDYDMGAAYPDNETQQASEGYELPGEFCSSIPAPEQGTLYFRAHAMVDAPGMLSDEQEIQIQAAQG